MYAKLNSSQVMGRKYIIIKAKLNLQVSVFPYLNCHPVDNLFYMSMYLNYSRHQECVASWSTSVRWKIALLTVMEYSIPIKSR